MRYDLRILGPVLLLLLAGYLASYADFSPSSLTSITGADVVDLGSCQSRGGTSLFQVSAQTNAHASYPNQGNYPFVACWPNPLSSPTTVCDGQNTVLRLSGYTNAHAEQPDQNNPAYNYPICFSTFRCSTVSSSQGCSAGSTCVATFSASTNAHVGDCSSSYPLMLCCTDTGGSGGGSGTPKIDTDQDGVYDDGDGKGIGNNPCDPKKYTSFASCDDNCKTIPNGQNGGTCVGGASAKQACDLTANNICPNACQINQEDSDGDGAGDACDLFPQDSCSLLAQGDNCKTYNACAQTLVAQWKQTTAQEGDLVVLEVTGDQTQCGNLTFAFRVFDSSDPNLVQQDPLPAPFTSGKAMSVWQAEYYASGSNKYSFQASSQQNIQVASSSNQLLTVNAVSSSSNASCGDGRTQRSQGEACDQGSNNCQYTKQQVESTGSTKKCGSNDKCYKDCKLIPGSQGQSCRTDPQCQGKIPGLFAVCDAKNPTTIAYCVRGVGGCLQLSAAQSCQTVGTVQQVCAPNLPTCISPTCKTSTQIGSCQAQTQQITCTATGGPHCTQPCQGYPKTQPCFEEPADDQDIPFFSLMNVLITILLLTTFYVLQGGVRRWK